MKVILQQDVKGQGKKGQLVNVSDGYARNFLLPKNLAVVANEGNITVLKKQEQARQAQLAAEKEQAKENAVKLEGCVVKLYAKAGENGKLFGSVTAKEIAEGLREQYGIDIEKNRIVMPDPIKTFGTFEVKCKLGFEINGKINVLVCEKQ